MRVLVLVMFVVVSLQATETRFSIDPAKERWSEIASGGYISQVATCSFDSLASSEFFVAVETGSRECLLEAREYPEGRRVALSKTVTAAPGSRWLRFDRWRMLVRFSRGRQYEFRLSWDGGPIRFYYRPNEPGSREEWLVVNGTRDYARRLACRVYGVMRAIDSTAWGIIPVPPWGDPETSALRARWKDRMAEANVHLALMDIYWTSVQPDSHRGFRFDEPDSLYSLIHDQAGCEVLARLTLCPKWASTRFDSVRGAGKDTFWGARCAPRNLYADVGSDTNYWARFIRNLVERYGERVHEWEIWNEPNDTCLSESWHALGVSGWWRRPNTYYDVAGGARGLCSLYVQLVQVAARTIKRSEGHTRDLILAGSLHRVTEGTDYLVPGKDWLALCYELAGDNPAWNGVAVHPYQGTPGFDPLRFEADAESLRAVMCSHGDYGPLRITEMGWPFNRDDPYRQAHNLCESYVSALASVALPLGGYDGLTWYCLRDDGVFGLLSSDSLMTPRPAFYALAQLARLLASRRFLRRYRVVSVLDESLRIYEFNVDSGFPLWVCWKNNVSGADTGAVDVKIPVECDSPEVAVLAYDSNPPYHRAGAGDDGWLQIGLTERPVFVEEKGPRSRPDLVVDSVRVEPEEARVGQRMVIHAWVRNLTGKETRATPEGMATKVLFLWNGDTLGHEETARSIGVGKTVHFEFPIDVAGAGLAGPALVKVVANSMQRYVELDMENNDGYIRAEVR